jgi:hypothetical protein
MTMAILVLICLLPIAVVVALVLQLLFRGKSSTITPGLHTPPTLASRLRYRDGAVTYRQLDGMRVRLRVENPYQAHPARYERRHRPKKHTPTKPWER